MKTREPETDGGGHHAPGGTASFVDGLPGTSVEHRVEGDYIWFKVGVSF